MQSDSADTIAEHLHTLAELELDFAREFIAAGSGAVPSSIKADPETYRKYLEVILDSAQVQLNAARQAADACLRRVAPESPIGRECRQSKRAADAIAKAPAAQPGP